jgi:peroxisomal enoyl-CoA hydratase 2
MTRSVTAPAFEDQKVGDAAPPLVVEDISRTHFVRYAGASGDFNPMHHDDTIATSVGNPSVFGHGMLTAGLMARVLTDWFGPTGLRRYQVRFSNQVWPGEALTCTATVTDLRDDGGDDQSAGLVDVECQVANQDGEVKLTGSATATVPKRAR